MKVIGVFPGGGIMGVISLACWMEIVKKTGKELDELLDLGIGTSIGAIIWGILSTGRISAADLMTRFGDIMPKTFKRRRFWFYPKYSRKAVNHDLDAFVGPDYPMSRCNSKVIITSVRAEDKTNHYFKSWQRTDGPMKLKEAITRSYAAPLFFGKWVGDGSTWLDGGTGSMNTPIIPAIWEAMRQGWLGKERVHVLSVGTGYTPEVSAHDKMQKMRWLREISLFFDPADGGLARYQSRNDNIKAAADLAAKMPLFSFQHVDTQVPRKLNRIDGVKHMAKYQIFGKQMAKNVDYSFLEG